MFALEDVGLAIETLLQVGENIVGYDVDYVKKYRINYRCFITHKNRFASIGPAYTGFPCTISYMVLYCSAKPKGRHRLLELLTFGWTVQSQKAVIAYFSSMQLLCLAR